jgi:hypothetical protein
VVDQLWFKQLIWPDIKNENTAKIARLPALIFSIFSTFLWTTMAVVTVLGHKSIFEFWVFLGMIFYAVVSVGLFKMRREASIAYSIVCVVTIIFAWGHTLKLISAIAGVVVSLFAIRGTFAYVQLIRMHNTSTNIDLQKSDT